MSGENERKTFPALALVAEKWGFSQAELAEYCGYTSAALNRKLNGWVRMEIPTAKKIQDYIFKNFNEYYTIDFLFMSPEEFENEFETISNSPKFKNQFKKSI